MNWNIIGPNINTSEGIDFYQEIFMSTALLNILRGWSDICIIIGLVSAALVKLDSEKKFNE